MQDMYPNLPGLTVDFKDGGLQVKTDPNPVQTESVLLLGTAIDGPLLEPVAVDPTTVELVFGKAIRANGLPNGSTLVKGFEQAYAAGCRDIRLMRITGSNAVGVLSAGAVNTVVDVPMDSSLGLAPGNDQTVFQLSNAGIIASSVKVFANGINIPASAFTVDPGVTGATPVNGSVTLSANATDSNASVYIQYQYTDGTNTVTTTQNSFIDDKGATIPYIAAGSPVILTLEAVASAGTLILYANGVVVKDGGYTLAEDGLSVTLNPGFVALYARLEATYTNSATTNEAPVINLSSVYAGSLYNGVMVAVKDIVNQSNAVVGKVVEITKPDSKKAQIAEPALTFSSLDYPSFQLLVNAINTNAGNNVVRASVPSRFKDADTGTLLFTSPYNLQNGDDGLVNSPDDLYAALGGVRDANGFLTEEGAYQLLENYTVDNVVPLGVNADQTLSGKYNNFAAQLALACAVMSFRNYSTIGHIATSSPDEAGLRSINNQVNALLATTNDYYMRDIQGNVLLDADGNSIDLGRFVNIIAGPDIVFTSARLGTYAENSAAAYAGYTSALAPQSSPTNKALPFAVGLRYQFSNAQLNSLTAARYVTFKTKDNGSTVAVTDAMTAAQPGSDYARLSTIRVVKEAINQVRIVADPFIGQPNEKSQQNALAAAISKRLDLLKSNGIISNYEFYIVASPQDQLLGQAKIELSIVPPQELRKLTTIVDLKPSL